MNDRERIAAAERAELAGDYLAAEAGFRHVADSTHSLLSAEAQFHLGRVWWRQGRFAAALQAFGAARDAGSRAAEPELEARAANGIGAVHYARGDYMLARQAYAAAAERTSDRAMRGKIILNLGVIENIEGDLESARAHYDRALELFTSCGDRASAMLALHNRGMAEADLEQWTIAECSFLDALALATELGHSEMIAKTLVNRSEVLSRRAAHRAAIDDCERALTIYAQIGDEVGRAEALRWHAHALAGSGQLVLAERSVNDAMRIAMRSGVRLLEAECLRELGRIRALSGDDAGWAKALTRAHELFSALGARLQLADVELELGSSLPHTDHSQDTTRGVR